MALLKMLGCSRLVNHAVKNYIKSRKQVIRIPELTRTLCTSAGEHKTTEQSPFPTLLTRENIEEFRGSFDTILTDCDGVFWSSDMLTNFENVGPTIEHIRDNGTRILFVSNNSLLDRYDYQRKFQRLSNFHADVRDIYVVSYVTAVYLKESLRTRKCYVIGTPALENELTALGIKCIGLGPDEDPPTYLPSEIMQVVLDSTVNAVVVSFDAHFSYNKLVKAASYLRDDAVKYIATCDKEMTIQLGRYWTQPLTGTIVQATSLAANRQPCTVIGKPHFTVMECIMRQNIDVDLERTVMIGDSLSTDIAFAKCCKMPSLLVLSGSTSYEDLAEAHEKNEPMPEYYTEKFTDLLELTDDFKPVNTGGSNYGYL